MDIPKSFLLPYSPIENQPWGNCANEAASGVLEGYYRYYYPNRTFIDMSSTFLLGIEPYRVSTLDIVLNDLIKYGNVPSSVFEYTTPDPDEPNEIANPGCYNAVQARYDELFDIAKRYKPFKSRVTMSSIEGIQKYMLQYNIPVAITIKSDSHAVYCVGWQPYSARDDRPVLIYVNSWGANSSPTGKTEVFYDAYGLIPYDTTIHLERGDEGLINSKDLNALRSDVCVNTKIFVDKCKTAGLPVLVTGTVRDNAYQEYCYYNGWSKTKIPSFHSINAGLAFDICKNVVGEEYSDTEFFKRCADIGKMIGFEWGGDWASIVDMPHFQWSEYGKYSSADIIAGRYPATMPLYKEETKEEEEVITYKTLEDVPDYGKTTINKLVADGTLKGDENGYLNITEDMLRIFVVLDRRGKL